MPHSRSAVNARFAIFAAVIALVVVLSRFLPVMDFVVGVQQQVAGWGAWSAVCYPLLFALCNLLLLPGGILCVGSGFFFGLWWGFFIVLIGNIIAAAITLPIRTRKKPHHNPKKNPLPTQRIPPGNRSRLHSANNSG